MVDRAVVHAAPAGRRLRPAPVAGDGLLHPIVLIAIGVLIANDHFLKAAYPGLVTGKLSDFAGLLFFPLVLQAAVEVVAPQLLGSRRLLIACIAATAVVFTAVKLTPGGAETYASVLGLGQWLAGGGVGRPLPISFVADPTDLIALLSLSVAYAIGRRRT